MREDVPERERKVIGALRGGMQKLCNEGEVASCFNEMRIISLAYKIRVCIDR